MASLARALLCLLLVAVTGPGVAVHAEVLRRPAACVAFAGEQASLSLARSRLARDFGLDAGPRIQLPPVDPVRALRRYTASIDQLVRRLDRRLVSELGQPPRDPASGRPVAYALFAMGSYARRELAPYSDLDYGIAIGDGSPAARAYFARYAGRLGELLRSVDPNIHPCNLLSASGEYATAVVDTPAGLAARLAARSADFARWPVRARDYLQAALSNTRPVLARGERGLHRELLERAERELGPTWRSRTPAGSARGALIERLRPSLRDPFGLPAAAADPLWSAGQVLPAVKDPGTAICRGEVNIKHDILRAFQTPILMLRERHNLRCTGTDAILGELARRGLLEPGFARELREAYRTALRLRTRRHLEAGQSEDRLGPLSPSDQVGLRRMLPLLRRLRRTMEPAGPH